MAKKPLQEDLFEGTSMSFGEHLEELRICLFRAILGVAVGCGLGFWIANNVVNFFQSPLESAMKEYYIDKATEHSRDIVILLDLGGKDNPPRRHFLSILWRYNHIVFARPDTGLTVFNLRKFLH